MNYFLLGLSFLVFTLYVSIIFISKGFLKSISESHYKLKDKNKWIFTVVMWSFSIPVMIVGAKPLMFFAGAGICFVGTAPAFKDDEMQMRIHMSGVISGIAFAMSSIWINYHMWYCSVGFGVISILLFLFTKKYALWCEILAFYEVLTILLLVNLK